MPAPKKKPTKTYEALAFGKEPEVPSVLVLEDRHIVHALNWYNAARTKELAAKWIAEELKRTSYTAEQKSTLVSRALKWCPTAISLMRMRQRGWPLEPKHLSFIDREAVRVLNLGRDLEDEDQPVPAAPKSKAPKSSSEQLLDYLETCYQKVLAGETAPSNMFADLSKLGCTLKDVGRLSKYFERERADFKLATEDEEYAQALSHLTLKRRKAVAAFFESFDAAIGMFSSLKKAAAKPRAVRKKAVKLDKLVARMKYKKSDAETKLNSIDPIKIIGASEVWVYNTKYRIVYRGVAEDGKTLSVKGSTVTGFDEKLSVGKKLRKPNVSLPNIMGGKVSSKRELEALKTNELAWTGRINEHTLILKVH